MKEKILLDRHNVFNLDIDLYSDIVSKVLSIKDVDDELYHHSVIYAHYHGLLIYVKRMLDKAELNFEQFCSAVKQDELIRNKSTGVRATATYLEDFLHTHPEYESRKNKILETQEIYGLVKSLCSGLDHKKDMLVQLSANQRSEAKINS